MIYLDNNATTALDPEVGEVMQEIWRRGPLNPSSQHAAGRAARAILEQACADLAAHLGADITRPGSARLLLTSGGTEANHLALQGLGDPVAPLILSRIEHPSVLEAARLAAARGRPVHWLPVAPDGRVDLSPLDDLLGAGPLPGALVSLMWANNETGVLQPVAEAARRCRAAGALLHTDATQVVGRIPVDFSQLDAAALTFTPHKFHGPIGIGGLLLAPGVTPQPQMRGGSQQLGLRPGTEAVPLAVGMRHALARALEALAETRVRLARLRDHLEEALQAAIPEAVIHGAAAERIPGTTCISLPGVDRQALLMRLDMMGVACSSGSACASGSSEPSHVLSAMGVAEELQESALRFGLSRFSTEAEVEEAINRILLCYHKLKSL